MPNNIRMGTERDTTRISLATFFVIVSLIIVIAGWAFNINFGLLGSIAWIFLVIVAIILVIYFIGGILGWLILIALIILSILFFVFHVLVTVFGVTL